MKKSLLILLTCFVLTLFSCGGKDDGKDDYIISDWYPIEFEIYVEDENGGDLLDKTSPDYVGEKLSLVYNDFVYKIEDNISKDYKPEFQGLIINEKGGRYCLYFGELEGFSNYDDDFVIKWEDGREDVIHFYRKITGSLDADDKWFLNGSDTKQNKPYAVFTITK